MEWRGGKENSMLTFHWVWAEGGVIRGWYADRNVELQGVEYTGEMKTLEKRLPYDCGGWDGVKHLHAKSCRGLPANTRASTRHRFQRKYGSWHLNVRLIGLRTVSPLFYATQFVVYFFNDNPSKWILEKEMATHSSVLAWRIPGTGEPRGLPSMGLHGVGHDWNNLAAAAAAATANEYRPWYELQKSRDICGRKEEKEGWKFGKRDSKARDKLKYVRGEIFINSHS